MKSVDGEIKFRLDVLKLKTAAIGSSNIIGLKSRALRATRSPRTVTQNTVRPTLEYYIGSSRFPTTHTATY